MTTTGLRKRKAKDEEPETSSSKSKKTSSTSSTKATKKSTSTSSTSFTKAKKSASSTTEDAPRKTKRVKREEPAAEKPASKKTAASAKKSSSETTTKKKTQPAKATKTKSEPAPKKATKSSSSAAAKKKETAAAAAEKKAAALKKEAELEEAKRVKAEKAAEKAAELEVKRAAAAAEAEKAAAEAAAKAYEEALEQVRQGHVLRSRATKSGFNEAPKLPSTKLNVYVFGSGSICELGLGPAVVEVKRPRLNPLLPIDKVGIVQLAVGGAHVLALDYNGRVWAWGTNDSGVLGRDTKENEDEADEHDDWVINSKESTPTLVPGLPENIPIVKVAASDNLSVAVDGEGHLWAWGTFIDDGKKCFKNDVKYQRTPIEITTVRNVVDVACGKDHVLILDRSGTVYSWGVGSSCQLGVKVNPNLRTRVFGPLKIPGLNKVKRVFAGEYHSFALKEDGKVFSWGLNNFGQAGNSELVGDGAIIEKPTHAPFFDDKNIVEIAGGNHHSLALTKDGDIYAFGEMNFHQLGLNPANLPESTVREKNGTPAYVPVPTKIEAPGLPKFKAIATGSDHSLAISAEDGSIWTWGFGETYQLGHGKPAGEDSPEDEEVPKRIDNTATRGVNMVFVGAGGQFSVAAGLPREEDVQKKEEEKKDVVANGSVNGSAKEATEKKEEAKEEKN